MEMQAKLAQLDARQCTSEHRIKDLENEVHDLRELTRAVAVMSESMHQLKERMEQLHSDVKDLSATPARRWNTVITTLITAVVSGAVGMLMASWL